MPRALILTFFIVLTSFTCIQAREITDMFGRRVTVPDTIRRVFTGSPPATYMLYALDPSLLVGINFSVSDEDKRYLRPEFTKLPVAGGVFGQGKNINMEALLALKPDVVLMWGWKDGGAGQQLADRLIKSGIATVFLDLDRLENYPEAFTFLGELLGRKERATKLANYARDTLRDVKTVARSIPDKDRLQVYYAEGPDGLATERELSVHAELITIAGARNVHHGEILEHAGLEKISMEQVLLYNPEVLLTHDRTFYNSLPKARRWQSVRAVKGKRVYLIPTSPFNWFDRPPSFMRLLGLKWLTNSFYPKRYPIDTVKETKYFYKLFLGVELKDKDVQEILHR